MMAEYQDIPRICTAFTEWLACVLYIGLFPKRWNRWVTVLLCGIFLILQVCFLVFTSDVAIYLWIPAMLFAIGMMYGFIFACTKVKPVLAGYNCAKAFLAAEFAAALEWQLDCFIRSYAEVKNGNELVISHGLMLVLYGSTFFIIYRMEKKKQNYMYCQHISRKEMLTVSSIALFSFVFSNMSFVVTNSPFSATALKDVFYIRTLGNLCGLIVLYAFQTRICEFIVENELRSIQSMYKKQYDQYRYYQNSMEMVHIKYHDLKHQIVGLRGEKDERKREEWLDLLEQELDENRLIQQTGNHVLDTVLGAKMFQAQKNHIRITCIADGKLLASMHVTDICTIFGNALDNAIESVVTLEDQTKRLIHLSLTRQKSFVLITISNYMEDNITLNKGELPKTSKYDKENHGYGLKSISQTVKKYNGTMSIQARDHWFELRILIPELK